MDKTAIQNLAIVLIGAKTIISDTDAAKAGLLAKTLWDISYRGMLELPHNWKFATTRACITGNLTTTPTSGQYSYQYKLPVLCLRVIAQIDQYDDDTEYDHKIENFLSAEAVPKTYPVILTNETTCYIKYIHDLNQDYEIRRWPSWFARIVALDLALLMCEPLKQDKQKVNQLEIKMHNPVTGWMDKAVAANGLSDSNTTSEHRDSDRGNNEVLNAGSELPHGKKYIISRE